MNEVTLHIDADILLNRAGFGSEKRIKTEMPDGSIESHIEVLDEADACAALDWCIENLRDLVKHDRYKLHVSGNNNFRKNVATILEYKGNRKRARKPIHFQALKDHIFKHHPYEVIHGQEADDSLGIALTNEGDYAIVASNDKDLRMVPGQHLVIKPDILMSELVTIDEKQGEHNFWMQMLEGDLTTDNILGCPQIGPKRAQGHLENCKTSIDYWRRVRRVYLEQMAKCPPDGFWLEGETMHYPSWRTGATMSKSIDDYLTEIGQLLWIRREPMQMWYPPTDARSPLAEG